MWQMALNFESVISGYLFLVVLVTMIWMTSRRNGNESPSYIDQMQEVDCIVDDNNQCIFTQNMLMKLDIQFDLYGGWYKTAFSGVSKRHSTQQQLPCAQRCTKGNKGLCSNAEVVPARSLLGRLRPGITVTDNSFKIQRHIPSCGINCRIFHQILSKLWQL